VRRLAAMDADVAVAALPAPAPAPVFSPATAGLTLIAAAAAEPIAAVVAGAMEMEGAPITLSVPPIRTTAAAVEDDEMPAGEEAAGSPCSVNSDCSSVASADFEGVGLGFFGAGVEGGAVVFEDSAASAATVEAEARVAPGGRSVFAVECVPLWGHTSICGRRPEMEDAVVAVPRFFGLPLWMLTGSNMVDGLDPISFRLPAHFFGVYDGHGGAQVTTPTINSTT
jgi:protein phosphatase 2C